MKAIDVPVPVLARFTADGQIQPIMFRHHQADYKVKLLKWWKYGSPLWSAHPTRQFCVVVEGDKVAELEWSLETGEWRLKKLG